MPALSLNTLNTLVNQNATSNFSTSFPAGNATGDGLKVVCAWPLSGQYGIGSRILYYVLVVACVVARKAEWLRNACLAAALLFPAVAAIHGIVLAAVHVDGAVDMDVYGAFQLCSIGILAAPVTARRSRTYFYDPGRNMVFLWTGLILAGLLSLLVEFYRLTASDCSQDNSGKPISPNAARFPYGNANCSLTCSVEDGPFSPMRRGSANNIYVVPVPDKLTFNTATLLAAACCIPAILSLIFMWIKILEINWKTRVARDEDERIDAPIQGTNGATTGEMKNVNTVIGLFLSALEIPVFSAAVLTILIMGEMNFFSSQVNYQTERMASIGQWGPIVGTGLAALGSLYLLLAADMEAISEEANTGPFMQHCNCSHHQHPTVHIQPDISCSVSSGDAPSMHNDFENRQQDPMSLQDVEMRPSTASSHSIDITNAADIRRSLSNGGGETSNQIVHTTSRSAPEQSHEAQRFETADGGYRRKVAKTLTTVGNYLGTAAHDHFSNSGFKDGKALDFPEIPGEELRNPSLLQIREQYNQSRDVDREVASGAASFAGSLASGVSRVGVERSSTIPRVSLSQSPQLSRSPSPILSVNTPRRSHANTLPSGRNPIELRNLPSSPLTGSVGERVPKRRDTLQVPSAVHQPLTRNNASAPS